MSLPEMSLADRVVLLTGVTGDIGATYVKAFTAAGASVVAADLPALEDDGQGIVNEATEAGPGRAVFVPCDITDATTVEHAVDTAVKEFGGLHSVVNNAAIYRTLGAKRPLTQLTCDEWELVLRVNVIGMWQVIKAAAPHLAVSGHGRIVNISSVVARNGAPGFAHYVASKAAVEGLTRSAARELGADGTTVNSVSPGLVDDTATRDLNSGDYLAAAASSRAIPRAMVPEDLVGAVTWLAGPASGFVTGQTLIVDGGGTFV
ncbi:MULTISPECIES: SDR family NAD(P)-dependent oxidoreductase [unclassified Nocardioides]|uniref:SDR family NAD(P)-dependent oxidoreductase n=1 Tax=unclassified Nocardioides TaxID=2615069 RepID=UPI0009F10B5C|nr:MULTISPECIES: SDR family oxidoreductase [unclassified Nocardioides]GAW51828.1 Dehydrogenase [Nocardioides sp. PD653-B2]GAW53518.1 Dehydrogenase [Nocardioides sp. PD653]